MKQRILLQGSQGLELLHRISSADILGLIVGEKKEGLILNPQGKIESHFEIIRITQDAAEILFEDGLLNLLEHYTFAERYELKPLPSLPESEVSDSERILTLSPKSGNEFLPDGLTNPLEVNLRKAIADQKGCYPGQEVIEKIISLGSPARRLCRVRRLNGSGSVPTPSPVFDANQSEVGILTTLSGMDGLAILKRTHSKVNQSIFISNQQWLVEQVAE